MSKQGLNPSEYFALLNQVEEMYKELSRLSDPVMEEYKVLLQKFIDVNSKALSKDKAELKTFNTTHKGKALEELVVFLLENTGLFKVHKNIRNTTNEIDQLLELTFIGNHFKEHLPFKGSIFLSECKNYNKAIDVTWIGKFHSLLVSNHSRYGFLFSYHGFTGSGWGNAVGLTKKLFLHKERMEDKIHIIDFNHSDFQLVAEGHSFLEILDSKIKELLTAADYTKYLDEKHPALLGDASDEE
ncbi:MULTISPECIES: acetylglutamate semialdehyde dehydrogenase [Paenibacillus]|uniref:acetylglutamate semialdehyde dehydrogenase n=1 Tax=Paenibacillus TaxID=44249 RepID=UPI00096F4F17|nr:acetylglutamate semialdehyde dehydrogenase [Paenibacillus odorifer]OMD10054.1 acetylglutamate semialdehyde dehydrogenase [Paenibacillus odorifer]